MFAKLKALTCAMLLSVAANGQVVIPTTNECSRLVWNHHVYSGVVF